MARYNNEIVVKESIITSYPVGVSVNAQVLSQIFRDARERDRVAIADMRQRPVLDPDNHSIINSTQGEQ